jgi:hypothetical protein
MLLVPAWAWRGGPVYRAVCLGVPVGIFLAALVFAESGVLQGALVAFVVLAILNGIMMARRMAKAWPAAVDLSPDERVAVSSAARRGHRIEDARLAPAAVEYVVALRNARAKARRWQWGVWLGGAAMVVLAVIDSFFATPRVAAVSWVVVAFFAVEILWWPRAQDRLLANAERTAESACQALKRQQVDGA